MYLSHGLPRIILTKRIRARSNHASSVIHAKGRARRRDRSNQASFTPKAAPAQTTLETAQITLARDSRQRPRPQARPLKKVAPAQG